MRFFEFLLLSLVLAGAVHAADGGKPNIIFILADDLGYSDIGCYGGEMQTPAIDRLAREGMYLTNMHNGGMCVLSRSCLMTGNYYPKMKTAFSKTPVLSEQLKAAGYRTALFGKWHLRGEPLDRGFDHFFGFLDGAGDHFAPSSKFRLDRAPFTTKDANYYSADAVTDHAVDFIRSPGAGQQQKPFFIYLAYQTPHSPLQAPKADVLRNRGKYLSGWQAIRDARFKRQKELGLVAADATLPDYPQTLPEWDSLSPAQKDLEDLRMAVYASMVERMDQGIARVMQTLEQSGQLKNTLVMFMSDNGPDPFSSGDSANLKKNKLPGDPGSNFQLGNGWAWANMTPWRQYKISQHEGGVRTGAIAWWPGVTGQPGRIDQSLVHFVDLMPTLLEVAGQSTSSLKIAGESFLPVLKGKPWHRTAPLFFQFTDNRAIRDGTWTMAAVDGKDWELYDARKDPCENVNVAAQHPEIVASLNQQWMSWWKRDNGTDTYSFKATTDQAPDEGHAYAPQGDRNGTGKPYVPSAMPAALANRYPLPAKP